MFSLQVYAHMFTKDDSNDQRRAGERLVMTARNFLLERWPRGSPSCKICKGLIARVEAAGGLGTEESWSWDRNKIDVKFRQRHAGCKLHLSFL
jgi:hypothetical protein